jgi:hypothetical protein
MTTIGRWLHSTRKVAAGVIPVIILCLLGQFVFGFEDTQLWTILATLPLTALFIVAYIPESPHKHWFGTSLILLAFAVLSVIIAAALFRIIGADYWGRQWLVTFWVGLTWTSMLMRTWVLLGAQIHDRHGVGWGLYRLLAALRRL